MSQQDTGLVVSLTEEKRIRVGLQAPNLGAKMSIDFTADQAEWVIEMLQAALRTLRKRQADDQAQQG